MPRNVRNFWVDLDVDGRSGRIGTGPVSRDGGFDMTIKMRDEGCVSEAVSIMGRANDDGTLTLRVSVPGREDIVVTTSRDRGALHDWTHVTA